MQDRGTPMKWTNKRSHIHGAIWLPLYCSQDFETIESGWKAILGHLASTVMNASWTTNHAYNGYSFPIMETLCIKIIKTNFGVYSLLRSVLPFVEFDLNFVAKTWLVPICQKKREEENRQKREVFNLFLSVLAIVGQIFLHKFADVLKTLKSPLPTNNFFLQIFSTFSCF